MSGGGGDSDNASLSGTSGDVEAKGIITPQEKALTNSVIIIKIFKKLKFLDWKNFRVVRKVWRNETLEIWRNSVNLYVTMEAMRADDRKGISCELFYELMEGRSNNNEGIYRILDYPFRHCSFCFTVVSFPIIPGKNPAEDLFWNVCGPHLTFLLLNQGEYYKGKFSESVNAFLLKMCPMLRHLKLSLTEKEGEMPGGKKKTGNQLKKTETPKVLEHMESLFISAQSSETSAILDLTPKLKSMHLYFGSNADLPFDGLPRPTANGEYIQLEILKVTNFHDSYNIGPFASLRSYTEMFPNTIKDMNLCMEICSVRQTAEDCANYYFSIGQCQGLETLKLTVSCENSQNLDCKWFWELGHFEFPSLKKFELIFNYNAHEMKFDFGSLRGMKNLKELYIQYGPSAPHREESRTDVRGTGDWLYFGPRDLFGGAALLAQQDQDPGFPVVPLRNLETLSFNGWAINMFDAPTFGEWFPALKTLRSPVCIQALHNILVCFLELEHIILDNGSFITLPELSEAKLKRSEVKFTVFCRQLGKIEVVKSEGGGEVTFQDSDYKY